MENTSQKVRRPVRQLSIDVARKIAAGEVIDRPAAIIRELLDNAVDSGADSITAEIKGGGIESIRVADNGWGMTKDDLQNCARPHCTSKIADAQDLMNLTTLGFRGEALASIAAVSRLTISSGNYRMTASVAQEHALQTIPPVQNGKGTIVQSEGLFENFPARRNFLKRPASETLMCREVFVEKALPKPEIAFRLVVDGAIRHDLPAGAALAERFTRALELKESSNCFSELKAQGTEADGKTKWSFRLVIGQPSVYRSDRKNIYIYVNGRRVSEYSLLQAIEYGCQGFFPNGTHPVAAVFLQVDPKVVDFNIHPAKKEVRFKDISSVHHGISSTVRTWLKSYSIKASNEISETADFQSFDFENGPEKNHDSASETSRLADLAFAGFSDVCDKEPKTGKTEPQNFSTIHNFSQTPFFSKSGEFHAEKAFTADFSKETETRASSRIADFAFGPHPSSTAFKEIKESLSSPPEFSGGTFHPHSEPAQNPEKNSAACGTVQGFSNSTPSFSKPDFTYFGSVFGTFLLALYKDVFYMIDQHAAHERINFNKIMEGGAEKQQLLIPYEITTESKADDRYLESIKDILNTSGFCAENKGNGKWEISSIPSRFTLSQAELEEALLKDRKNPEEIIYHIAATTACKMSVKDGTLLGADSAAKLAWEALQLKDPHCPHGRPVWTAFTKEELFARVRRT